MGKEKSTVHQRIPPETKDKADQLAILISSVQKKQIKTPEIIKRAFNIPNIQDILIKDAEVKRIQDEQRRRFR